MASFVHAQMTDIHQQVDNEETFKSCRDRSWLFARLHPQVVSAPPPNNGVKIESPESSISHPSHTTGWDVPVSEQRVGGPSSQRAPKLLRPKKKSPWKRSPNEADGSSSRSVRGSGADVPAASASASGGDKRFHPYNRDSPCTPPTRESSTLDKRQVKKTRKKDAEHSKRLRGLSGECS